MLLAFLGFYSIVSMIAAYLIMSYNDWATFKAYRSRIASRRIDKIKAGKLVFLSSIVQYTEE